MRDPVHVPGHQGMEDKVGGPRDVEDAMARAVAQERERYAHDLHDGLGQLLAAISFRSEALQFDLHGASPAARKGVEDLCALVQAASAQARAIAHGLAPPALEEGGLRAGLLELAGNAEKAYGVTCACDGDPGDVPASLATPLYWLAQASLQYVIHRSRGRRVVMHVHRDAAAIALTVRGSDGKNAPSVDDSEIEWTVIRRRAGMLGAVVELGSAADGAPEIRFRMPMPAMVP